MAKPKPEDGSLDDAQLIKDIAQLIEDTREKPLPPIEPWQFLKPHVLGEETVGWNWIITEIRERVRRTESGAVPWIPWNGPEADQSLRGCVNKATENHPLYGVLQRGRIRSVPRRPIPRPAAEEFIRRAVRETLRRYRSDDRMPAQSASRHRDIRGGQREA